MIVVQVGKEGTTDVGGLQRFDLVALGCLDRAAHDAGSRVNDVRAITDDDGQRGSMPRRIRDRRARAEHDDARRKVAHRCAPFGPGS